MDSSYLAARCRGRLGVFATSSLASSSWKEVPRDPRAKRDKKRRCIAKVGEKENWAKFGRMMR